jgi:uncharacterized membrane protein YidH (DUF202 family)
VIPLVAVILAAIAAFGVGVARVSLQDVGLLETQETAQRAAEAAAGVAAELVAGGGVDPAVSAAANAEATRVSNANVTRGTVRAVTATWTSSATELVVVTISLTCDYGGFAGPFSADGSGRAAVPRPRGP